MQTVFTAALRAATLAAAGLALCVAGSLHATTTVTCAPVHFDQSYVRISDNGTDSATYQFDPGLDLGLGSITRDSIQVEFYGSGYGATGVFDLSAPPQDNYGTCTICVKLLVDVDSGGIPDKSLFQTEGLLTVSMAPGSGTPTLDLQFGPSTLREVTIDPNTFQSTVVPDGLCATQSFATFFDGFEN